MHDPLVVAFEIYRPWPKRWKLSTDRHWWFPPLITVWHVEPAGRDSGTVCSHWRADPSAPHGRRYSNRWRLHVHHWRIQVHPLQELRRRLLTRCAGCGGRSTKANPVNVSLSWSDDGGPWWRGEEDLYHHGCHARAATPRIGGR